MLTSSNKGKQLSMAVIARVIWLCACVRYWPYRGVGTCASVHNLILLRHAGKGCSTGTVEGEGLVGPRSHHIFAPPPPLFVLKRKIIKI